MDGQIYDSPAASKFLQTCEVLTSDVKIEPFTIVLFGETGAKRLFSGTHQKRNCQ